MFREMRRNRQQLSQKECIAILEKGTSGVLSLYGDDGYPYGVPMSYAYSEGKLYFHCALEGHKIDSIKRNNKVSFCVIDKDEVIPEKYTTHFRSVIVFGRAKFIEEKEEKIKGAIIIGEKYNPNHLKECMEEIDRFFSALCVIEVSADHITGKAAKEIIGKKA